MLYFLLFDHLKFSNFGFFVNIFKNIRILNNSYLQHLLFLVALSDFITQIFPDDLIGITKLFANLAQLVITQKKQHHLIINLDSTHSDTLDYHRKSVLLTPIIKRTVIFISSLSFENSFGHLLGAKLQPSNKYTSKKAENFSKSILQRYTELDLLIRADSVFAKSEFYTAFEEARAKFTNRLKTSLSYNGLPSI